jgi:hypothetical protein
MAFMRDPLYILMQDGVTQIHKDGTRERLVVNQDLFDDIVMMRYYNMTKEERRAAIKRVLEDQFETGADGIRKASGLPTTMERSRMALGLLNMP